MLVVIVGKSGVGKTTLLRKLMEHNIDPIDTYTSRPLRDDDLNYYPIDSNLNLNNPYEINGVNGHKYILDIPNELSVVRTLSLIDMEVARNIQEKYKHQGVLIYILEHDNIDVTRDSQTDRDKLVSTHEDYEVIGRGDITNILETVSTCMYV